MHGEETVRHTANKTSEQQYNNEQKGHVGLFDMTYLLYNVLICLLRDRKNIELVLP